VEGASVESRLATLIREQHADILAAWEASVRTLASAATTPRGTLFDRLPRFLGWLADRLEDEAHDAERDTFARHHALERLSQDFDVVELIAELALLRECVLGAWEADPAGVEPSEIRRLDAEIDHVMALCAVEYVRHHANASGAGAAAAP
jgi:hypothetical protein